jgi:hypothetical protein
LLATAHPSAGANTAAGASETDEADETLRKLALRALFREPAFAARDGLDDYDGDYTYFEPRGDLLTYDMLRALERVGPTDQTPDPDANAAANTNTAESSANGDPVMPA